MSPMAQFGYPGDYLLWWVIFSSLVIHTWCFFRFVPRNKHRRLALVAGNSLVLLCFLGAAALAAETYFRYVAVELDPFGTSLPARRWFALHTRLNSLGCRDPEWTRSKPPGVRRIAVVGDSFVFGWGIERVEDRVTERLQAQFAASGRGTMEIMNVAKPGWGTLEHLNAIPDLIDGYGVDEILLCYVPNDIEDLLPRTFDFNPTQPPDPAWFNPDCSYLLDYLRQRVWLPRVPTVRGYHDWLATGYDDSQTWIAQQQRLASIIDMCRRKHVTLRAALLPYLKVQGGHFDAVAIHDRVEAFFDVQGIPVVDLLTPISAMDPDTLVVSRWDTHPNELAHRILADCIWHSFYKPSPD